MGILVRGLVFLIIAVIASCMYSVCLCDNYCTHKRQFVTGTIRIQSKIELLLNV